MLRTTLLAVHVVGGIAGLILGPAAMAATVRGRRGRAIVGYHVAVAVLAAAAVGLAVFDWGDLWPFVLLAAGTEAAVVGSQAVGGRGARVRLLCGSYVSLVTALLVVSWGSLLAWILPTVVGTVLVEAAATRAHRALPTTFSKTRS